MEAKRDDGLTAKQERFAALVARGLTQSDAYRQAYNVEGMTDKQVWEEASKLRKHPKVSQRISEILESARIEDIDSANRAFNDLLRGIEEAFNDRNWTAYASLMRQRLQFHGLLKDKLELSQAETLSDEQLIKELAGDDPEKRKLVADMIGYRGEAG